MTDHAFMRLESARGCIQHCTYCFYTQHYKSVKYFSLPYVEKILEFARDNGAQQISFTDPNFNDRSDFSQVLQIMERFNDENSFQVFVECDADRITDPIAQRMKKAGIQATEIGLQTTNETARKTIKRAGNLKKFLRGIRALQSAGIEPVIDIMLGLPHDTVEDFKKTASFILIINSRITFSYSL